MEKTHKNIKKLKFPCKKSFIVGFLATIIMLCMVLVTQVSAFDWTDNIIAYYNLENNLTGYNDSTGNNYNFTDVNDVPISVDGILDNSTDFDGTNDEVRFNQTSVFVDINTTSVWINSSTDYAVQQPIVAGRWDSNENAGDWNLVFNNDETVSLIIFLSPVSFAIATSDNILNDSQWHHLVSLVNESGTYLFVDGVMQSTFDATKMQSMGSGDVLSVLTVGGGGANGAEKYTNVTVDEFGLWNRSLSESEIVELYNSGNGLNYGSNLNVTANFPEDNYLSYSEGDTINFNITSTSLGSNLINITLIINGVNNETKTITGLTNETIFTKNFSNENISWNVEICDVLNFCVDLQTDLELETILFTENNITFTNETFETEQQTFSMNLTYNSSHFSTITSNLIYNGSSYVATRTGSGDEAIFSATINVPVHAETTPTNFSFFWQVFQTNVTSIFELNSSITNQTANPLDLGTCAGDRKTVIINYSVFDEQSLAQLSGFDFEGSFEFFIQAGTVTKNISVSTTGVAQQLICVNVNQTYIVDSVIEVQNSSYQTKVFNFNNQLLNNSTTQQPLYLMPLNNGSQIIIRVVDSGLLPLENLFVEVQRFVPSLDDFITVDEETTDEFGQFVSLLIENDVKYKFFIRNSSNDLLKETEEVFVACTSSFCVIQFVVEDTVDDFEQFEDFSDFESTLSFDNSTNIFTVSWNDITGDAATMRLVVQRILANGTTTVCNTTSTAAASSLTCNVGTQPASYSAQFYRTVGSDTRRLSVLNVRVGDPATTFLLEGLIWVFLALFTLVGVGTFNPNVAAVLYFTGFILFGILGIISFSIPIFFANLVIVGVFIWAFRS